MEEQIDILIREDERRYAEENEVDKILTLFTDWLSKRGISMPLSDYEDLKDKISKIL